MTNNPPGSPPASPVVPANPAANNAPEGLLHGHNVSGIQPTMSNNGATIYCIFIDPPLTPQALGTLNSKLTGVQLQQSSQDRYLITGRLQGSNFRDIITSEQQASQQPPQNPSQQPPQNPSQQPPQNPLQQPPQNPLQQPQSPQIPPQASSPAQVAQHTGNRAANVLSANPSNFYGVTLEQIKEKSLKGSVRTYNAIRALGVRVEELRLLAQINIADTANQLFNRKLSELKIFLSANNRQLESSEVAMLNAISRRIEKLNNDPNHWSKFIAHLTHEGILTK